MNSLSMKFERKKLYNEIWEIIIVMKRKNTERIIVIALLIFLAFIRINHQTNKYDNLEVDSSELNIFSLM